MTVDFPSAALSMVISIVGFIAASGVQYGVYKEKNKISESDIVKLKKDMLALSDDIDNLKDHTSSRFNEIELKNARLYEKVVGMDKRLENGLNSLKDDFRELGRDIKEYFQNRK